VFSFRSAPMAARIASVLSAMVPSLSIQCVLQA
jgi:hypothetical protein